MYSQVNVYHVAEIRALETTAIQQGISAHELMQRAGHAVFRAVSLHFSFCQRIAIVVGGGNNGGDGLVVASLLQQAGYFVTVHRVHGPLLDLANYDLLIDAICGIGLEKPLNESAQRAVDAMNQANRPILAIDVPTGIHADTGLALGRPIEATLTVTFIGMKTGLLDADGIRMAGELMVWRDADTAT